MNSFPCTELPDRTVRHTYMLLKYSCVKKFPFAVLLPGGILHSLSVFVLWGCAILWVKKIRGKIPLRYFMKLRLPVSTNLWNSLDESVTFNSPTTSQIPQGLDVLYFSPQVAYVHSVVSYSNVTCV